MSATLNNMNVYNPNNIGYSDNKILKLIKNKKYIIIHFTGNYKKIKNMFNNFKILKGKIISNITENYYWYLMPEYKLDKKMYLPFAYILFSTKRDKKHFLKRIDKKISDKARYFYYPKDLVNKTKIYEYKIKYKINPKYPIYIVSKGRWEKRKTVKALESMNCPYKIVIEPSEYAKYAEVINKKNILLLPNKYLNLNKGSIPARNFVWQHAVSKGYKKHWILDDNLNNFYRFNKNTLWKINSGVVFKIIEDYVSRFKNIKLSGMNYQSFVIARSSRYPLVFNTRIYSCILIDHSLDKILKERWRGKYNEDTDLSIRVLKKGYSTCLFNAIACDKTATLRDKGGNTDLLYKQGQYESLKLKAESLRKQHPDIVKIVERYQRGIHHEVNYNVFKDIDPMYVSKIKDKSSNNYNMYLSKKKLIN